MVLASSQLSLLSATPETASLVTQSIGFQPKQQSIISSSIIINKASSLIALDILRKIEKTKDIQGKNSTFADFGGKKVVFSCFGIEIFGGMKKKV